MEYLDASDAVSRRAIIDHENRDAVVYMRRTKWYNLEISQARYSVLCHLLALIRFHVTQEKMRSQADDFSSYASEDDSHDCSESPKKLMTNEVYRRRERSYYLEEYTTLSLFSPMPVPNLNTCDIL